MSVLIGSARIDENGKSSGGSAGDSTGTEVSTQNWYLHSKGWYVIRPNTEAYAYYIACNMQYACDNANIGYDQSQNKTLYDVASTVGFNCSLVTTPCETDCARLVRVCVLYAGIEVGDFYTGNLKTTLSGTGMFTVYETDDYCKSSANLLRGDILVTRTKGHAVVVLSNGENATNSNYAMSDPSGGGSGDSSESITESLEMLGALYAVEVTKGDALLREVGYINTSYQPSIESSSISLTVINYTNMLGNLFAMYVPQYISDATTEAEVNVDNIDHTDVKAMLRYLMDDKELSCAASCGIVANIEHESNYDTSSVGDSGTSFGLCQWHGERGEAMKKFVGDDWRLDLSGQLDYLWHELEDGTHCKGCLAKLKAVTNTLEGAKQAADIFIKTFERPADVDKKSLERQQSAKALWEKIVLQQTE